MQKKIARHAEQNIKVFDNRFYQSDIPQKGSQNSVTKRTLHHQLLLAKLSYLLSLLFIFGIFPCYSNANDTAENVAAPAIAEKSTKTVIKSSIIATRGLKRDKPKVPVLEFSHIKYSEYKYTLDDVQAETTVVQHGGTYNCNRRIFSKLTRDMVSGFTGNNPLPHGYISRENGEVVYGPKAEDNKWGDLLNQYPSLNALVMFILFLAILIPLIGLIYYCCRLRGKCGARSESCEKKNDKMLCICLSLLLLLLLLLIILPLFYAFKSNIYLQRGLSDLEEGKYGGGKIASDIQDLSMRNEDRIKNAQNYVNHVLVINYKEFYDGIQIRIKDAINYITTSFKQNSATLKETVQIGSTILPKLIEMEKEENEVGSKLTSHIAEFIDALRATKRAIIKALYGCTNNNCVVSRGDRFLISLDQTNFADPLVGYIHKLELFGTRLKSMYDIATNATKTYENYIANLLQVQEDFPPRVIALIKDVEPELEKYSAEIQLALNGVTPKPDLNTGSGESGDNKTKKVKSIEVPSYVIFFGLVVCIILLLIIIFLIAAILCGICSKHRGKTNSKLCNKSFASRLLILALYLIFIFYALIALVLLIHLLLGTVAYRGICNTKGKQSDTRNLQNVDGHNNPNENENKLVCNSKENFYTTLRTKNVIRDIKEINDFAVKYDMSPEILKLTDYYNFTQYRPFFVPSVNNTYYRQQRLYVTIGLDFLDHRILNCIENASKQYYKMFIPNPDNPRTKEKPGFDNWLKSAFTNQIYKQMAVSIARLKKIKPSDHKDLEEAWRSNQKAFDAIINDIKKINPKLTNVNLLAKLFFDDTKMLEDLMLIEMINLSNTVINKLKTYCLEEFRLYLKRSVDLIENEVGVCPKQRVKRSSSTSTTGPSSAAICYCVVDPMNAFWLFLLLCAILLLPILLLVPCLAYLLGKPCGYEEIKKTLPVKSDKISKSYQSGHMRTKQTSSIIIDCKGGGIRIGCVPRDFHSKSNYDSCECLEEYQGQRQRKGKSKSKGRWQNEIASRPIISIDCVPNDTDNRQHSGRRNFSIDRGPNDSDNRPRGRRTFSIDCGPKDNDNRPCGSRQLDYSGRRNLSIDEYDDRPSGSKQLEYSGKRNFSIDDYDNRPSGSRQYEYSGRRNVSNDFGPNDNRPSGSRQHEYEYSGRINDKNNRPSGSRQHKSDYRRSEGHHSKHRSGGVISIDIRASKKKKREQKSKESKKQTIVHQPSTALQRPKQDILKPCECSTSVRSRRAPTENEPEQSSLSSPRAHNMTVVIKKIKYKNPTKYCRDKNS